MNMESVEPKNSVKSEKTEAVESSEENIKPHETVKSGADVEPRPRSGGQLAKFQEAHPSPTRGTESVGRVEFSQEAELVRKAGFVEKAEIPKLFGTDGIRGTANLHPMTADLAQKVGQAMGYILRTSPNTKGEAPMVLIGKDTRISGYMVEQALSSGFNSMGIRVNLTGPLPTPGIGFLAQNMRASAGIVISASHNPFHDNGIKIFGADGFKIPDEMERGIERLISVGDLNGLLADPDKIGRTRRIEDAAGRYIVYVKHTFPLDMTLDGARIVLDCANGAGYKVAPDIFEELGAEVIVLGNQPDGYNINNKSGALFPERTCEAVKRYRADVGIALDGDADRVIMVDERGRIVNGDHILAICAIHMSSQKQLPKSAIVATQMSNIGLDYALKKYGIRIVRTDVGDKNVIEEMRRSGYTLGGEQSGHIICLDHSTTGDGCVAALHVLAVMKQQGKKLSELKDLMTDIPQVLVNIRVSRRENLDQISGYPDLIEDISKKLSGEGRIFVRFSGTEPMVRILVEGPHRREIGRYAEIVAQFLQSKLAL